MWLLGKQVDSIECTSATGLFFFSDCIEPSPFQECAEFLLWNYSPPLCISFWQGNRVNLGKGNACWQPKTKQN